MHPIFENVVIFGELNHDFFPGRLVKNVLLLLILNKFGDPLLYW